MSDFELRPLARRRFLATAGAAAAATAVTGSPARAAARYTRYNVTSPQGQEMLRIYALAVERMLALPPTHPHNWFRNAFVHFMDCPHGNWWFYVWHRGYIGYFEQTIRAVSGNSSFTLPYWDWTRLPRIPDAMFTGVLDPTSAAYARFTKNLAVFTDYIKPTLQSYWSTLTPAQLAQQKSRSFNTFTDLWNNMLAWDPTGKIASAGDIAFAPTCSARYLTRDNPAFNESTAKTCTPEVVLSGLYPIEFNDEKDVAKGFTSARTASHNTPPTGRASFSILEGQPHNTIHNYIGGAGPLDYGPYGNMTNNLSPVDPIFFLHHSNMDRLWDVWTRKQQRIGQPFLPPDPAARAQFLAEPFLFFVDGNGRFVTDGKAADYVSTARFDYDYQPGFPEAGGLLNAQAETQPLFRAPSSPARTITGTVNGNNSGTLSLPAPALRAAVGTAAASELTLEVTIVRPGSERIFDVVIDGAHVATISFFGPPMHGMAMPMETTFAVPLVRQAPGLLAATGGGGPLTVSVVPTQGRGVAPRLTALAAVAR
ncbi:MAG TPA: tyrosinase family protein [Candidatus Sulfotelmatobacter sp.]|nr:tyrosinase family protein [Candidatus Sulfotelmatobacter sp.]